MRTLPLKIASAAALALALTSCSASDDFQRGLEAGYDAARSSAAQPPPVVTSSAPTSTAIATEKPAADVVLPEVKGRNGKIVYAELRDLGLTDVSYASRDADDKVVINPANWTAVKIEPKAGTTVKSDAPVVVTMTKD